MGRSTKPVRIEKDDAKLIQAIAEERDARPAEVVSDLLAGVDTENVAPELVGSCPVCGHQFTEDDVRNPILAKEGTVKCPDPDDRHRETGLSTSFRVSELDNDGS